AARGRLGGGDPRADSGRRRQPLQPGVLSCHRRRVRRACRSRRRLGEPAPQLSTPGLGSHPAAARRRSRGSRAKPRAAYSFKVMRDRQQGPNEDETPAEVERLLRALADQEAGSDLPAPGDERLRAYREGRLTAGETRELEILLARSTAGRRRLLELAGIDRSLPLRRVRRAVLGAAEQRRRRGLWVSVAAVAAMAASIVLALL